MKLILNVTGLATAVALAASITGCVGYAPESDPDESETVGESADALTTIVSEYEYGGSSATELDLGVSSNKTCFLTGVKGSLHGSGFGYGFEASVGVYNSGGHWWLRTDPGLGGGNSALVKCINAVANRVTMGWNGDWHYGASVPAGNGNRVCFLTAVWSTVGFSGTYNGTTTGVWVNGTTLNGYLEPRQDGGTGGGGAAVCVDIPSVGSASYSWYAGYEQTVSYSIGSNTTGMLCGITSLGGAFDGATNYHGARVQLNPYNNVWQLVSQDAMGSDVRCLWTQ